MNQNRKLGRGLDALIQRLPDISTENQPALRNVAESTTASQQASSLVRVDPRSIQRNPQQPRRDFDESGIQELADSIREKGILQPLVVRRMATGELELIAGERRWRAALRLELPLVPVVVRETEDSELLELALIENIQRQDLNPIEEATAYHEIRDAHGWTQEQLASRLGKKRSTIANALRLLELPSHMQTAVRSGQILPGHAKVLLSLDGQDRQGELYQRLLTDPISVRELEELAALPPPPLPALPGSASDLHAPPTRNPLHKAPHVANEESTWSRTLGTKVEIKERGGKGKVLLHFFSNADYERLKNLLLSP